MTVQKQEDRCWYHQGAFFSRYLHLKSDVDLHLEQGAVLISSLEQEDMIDFAREYEDDNADVGWDGGPSSPAMGKISRFPEAEP